MSLEQGQSAAILGQSGSGKSTLLSLIAGLDQPDSGQVCIDGQCLTSMDEAARTRFRASRLGIVFQQFHLMPHLTAWENVTLPLELQGQSRPEGRARELLQAVGLEARSHHLPSQLSGGECQRVALARALAPRPKLLLCDEPTGNLDEATGSQIVELLFGLAQQEGTSLVIVTHNQQLAGRCGLRFHLLGGKLVPEAAL